MGNFDLHGGVLDVWTLADLEEAEREVDPQLVTCIGIGARLYNGLPQPQLLDRIGAFPRLSVIVLSDDWIDDSLMADVEAAFLQRWPGVTFSWQKEGLAAGKHGR